MPKKIPERKCISCGLMKPKSSLVRIVRTPEGGFIVDTSGKASGRGAYICRDAACLERAEKNHGLERSFGQKLSTDIYDSLRRSLSNE